MKPTLALLLAIAAISSLPATSFAAKKCKAGQIYDSSTDRCYTPRGS